MTKVEGDTAKLFSLIQKKENQFTTRLSVSFPPIKSLYFLLSLLMLLSSSLSELAQLNYQKPSDNMAGGQDGRKLPT